MLTSLIMFMEEVIEKIHETNVTWIIIPIFFIGVITDKYQEEYETPVGNAISNGALVLFSAFSWIQHISSRVNFPLDITLSQYLLSFLMILYGFAIIASGFRRAIFAQVYGRIRVITFMLIFFTLIIYIPYLYNFISILFFVVLFPIYYALITTLIKKLPNATNPRRNKHLGKRRNGK